MSVRSFLAAPGVAAEIAYDSVLTLGRKVQLMSAYDSTADSVPSPQGGAGHKESEFRVDSGDDAIAEFVDTVNDLGVDGRWLVQGLTDFLRRQKRGGGPGMTAEERKFVVESGSMTEAELVDSEKRVAKGSLEKSAAELWLGTYQETWSASTVAHFMGWTEDEVLAAAEGQRIYGVPVRDRLRFPRWQFSLGSPGRLIPHLETVLPVLTEHWDWISISAFMSVRQRSLVAEGRKTPRSWLRDGGDPAAISEIIEGDKYW
ncbi:hypothetical protein ABID81_002533 [Frigoribacterium sp. PvP054]